MIDLLGQYIIDNNCFNLETISSYTDEILNLYSDFINRIELNEFDNEQVSLYEPKNRLM